MKNPCKISIRPKIIIAPIFMLILFSCQKNVKNTQSVEFDDYAAFDWFEYKGNDEVYNKQSKTENEYYNPILAGFYPDPSICRADDKFYLITSSFSYFPGIPIFESEDLVNWKQIGHAIHRESQVDFDGLRVSRGMFAPTIRYHEGTFYIICTSVDSGGNFIVTANDPKGPWSNPIWIPGVDGIDPDLFFDDDGKLYITHNGPPPNNKPLHDGHRAIYMFEYNIENQKIVGDSRLIVNGGTDMTKKPVWIEAPHVIKKYGYYYLICAEGGTAFNHSEVVFRSKHVFGPYEVYQNNPILTQRHLDPNRENIITTSGHADFVETPNGDWWSVFLACRPYGDDLFNIGRETFMLPVEWKDGWPTIVGGNDPISMVYGRPNLDLTKEKHPPINGNFTIKDDFKEGELDFAWNFIRTPKEKWYTLNNGNLYIKPRKETIHTLTNYSFIGRRQQHSTFEASIRLNYKLKDTLEAVGMVAFQNENYFLFIGKRLKSNNKMEVFVQKKSTDRNEGNPEIIASMELDSDRDDLFLKIKGKPYYYNFYFKTKEQEDWRLLASDVDGTILSTKKAKGFVGTYLAMYASTHHFEQ